MFLIGMRVNRPLKAHKWFPLIRAMLRMLRELSENQAFGYLGSEHWFGRTSIALQYWRSSSDLLAYATDENFEHAPAWVAFTRSAGRSGTVGIWHETYTITPGAYETFYQNMPPFGLGRIGKLAPASGRYHNAKQRFEGGKRFPEE